MEAGSLDGGVAKNRTSSFSFVHLHPDQGGCQVDGEGEHRLLGALYDDGCILRALDYFILVLRYNLLKEHNRDRGLDGKHGYKKEKVS